MRSIVIFVSLEKMLFKVSEIGGNNNYDKGYLSLCLGL